MRANLTLLLLIAILFCTLECKRQKEQKCQSAPLISDITRESLVLAGKSFKVKYLGINKDKPKTKYDLAIWGAGLRVMTYLPVRLSYPGCKTNINVVFVVDTGSPNTSLTDEVFIALHKACPQFKHVPNEAYYIRILGHVLFTVSSKYSYMNINILGTDFLDMANARLYIQYEASEVGYGSLKITPKLTDRPKI